MPRPAYRPVPSVTYNIVGEVTLWYDDSARTTLTWEDAESFARELLSCIEGAKPHRPRSNAAPQNPDRTLS